jgi:hypothetical protein
MPPRWKEVCQFRGGSPIRTATGNQNGPCGTIAKRSAPWAVYFVNILNIDIVSPCYLNIKYILLGNYINYIQIGLKTLMLVIPVLWYLDAGTALLATLRGCLAFATGLWAFVAFAAASLGQDAVLLYFAGEPLEGHLKRVTWIHFDLTHRAYQRDLLRLFERPAPRIPCP